MIKKAILFLVGIILCGYLNFAEAEELVLLADDFSDNNHNGWTVTAGSWMVINEELLATSFNNQHAWIGYACGNTNWQNYSLEFDWSYGDGTTSDGHIWFRVQDSNPPSAGGDHPMDGYCLQIMDREAPYYHGYTLRKSVEGHEINLIPQTDIPYGVNPKQIQIKVVEIDLGTRIKIYLNGSLLAEFNDTDTNRPQYGGICLDAYYKCPQQTWDNFYIKEISTPVIINDIVTFQLVNVSWDPITKIFAYDVALFNIGSQDLYSPIAAVISSIYPSPPVITLNNTDGGGNGIGAYWDYNNSLGSDNELSPGETSTAKCWEFYNPNMVGFYFSCDIYGVPASSLPKIAAGSGNSPFAMTNDIEKQLVMINRGDINVAEIAVPKDFVLEQNFPNPFNAETMIKYQLPEPSKVGIKILNLLGQEIRTLVDGHKAAGFHVATWNGKDNSGKDVASGIYIYQIQAGDFVDAKKMELIR